LLAIALMVAFYLLAAVITIGLLWIPYAALTYTHQLNIPSAVMCLATALALVAAVFPRADRFKPPGPRLDENDHKQLFATIRSVADATSQRMPEEVFLVNQVNAWVSHRGGTMGFGSRRVMGLGLPLLQGLTVSELEAVLAHEFGHYAAGDVRLGPWIYKTRAAIGRTIQSVSESALSVFSGIFTAYGRLFMRTTLAISRQQEFLADDLASRVANPAALASALRRTDRLAPVFVSYWTAEVAPALHAGYLPPIASGFTEYLDSPHIADVMSQTAVRDHPTSELDTHPPLQERLAALSRIAPSSTVLQDRRSAATLLGDVDEHARQLVVFSAGEPTTSRFRRVGWEQLGSEMLPAMWRGAVQRYQSLLAPYTVDAFPPDRAELARLGAAFPGAGTRSSNERMMMGAQLIASAIALVLLEEGATFDTRPGRPHEFRLRDISLNPFVQVNRFVAGETALSEWRAQCHALGIAGRPLTVPSSRTSSSPPAIGV